jgi:putative membrane protein
MRQENRGLLVILGVLIAALLIGPVLMGGTMGPGVMGPGMMGWGYTGGAGTTNGWVWGLGMALGGLMMLAFWGAVITGIVLLVRLVAGQSRVRIGTEDSDDPLTILRRRYAAGEIDQAIFERMQSELGDPRQPANADGRTEAIR